MKNIRIFGVLMALCLMLTCLAGPVHATNVTPVPETTPQESVPNVQSNGQDLTVVYGSHTADGKYPVHGTMQMVPASRAAILYEVSSDSLVYAYNPDTPLHPSSLVKIMTALIAIEAGDLDEMVQAEWDVLDTVPMDAMKAGIQGGELFTVEQLLYAMIVGSGNDAAALLADHIAGSQAAFVDRMNRRALQLGCTDTTFVNVTGLHEDDQVTTARDMVKILRKALEYPVFEEIFTTDSYFLPATAYAESRYLQTTNYMQSTELTQMYYDDRVTGGRTGVTNDGYRCLAITAEQNNAYYICVILEAKTDYSDTGAMIRQGSFEDASMLLDIGFDQSDAVQVLRSGQAVEQLSVDNSTNDVVIGPLDDIFGVLPIPYLPEQLTYKLDLKENLQAPVEEGTYVGEYQVWYRSACIATAKLYTLNGTRYLAPQTTVDPQENPAPDMGSLLIGFAVLGVILGLILIYILIMFLLRRLRNARLKAKMRNRRVERRRSK